MNASPDLLLQPYLARDERLLWSGNPIRRITIQKSDFLGFAMGIFGIGFFTMMSAGLWTNAGKRGELLFIVPFALIWIAGAAGQPIWRARGRQDSIYGLTDRRAVILNKKNAEIQSIALSGESIVTFQKHRDGTGTILFGNHGMAERQQESGPAFRRISDVNTVYQIIQGIQTRQPSQHWQSA